MLAQKGPNVKIQKKTKSQKQFVIICSLYVLMNIKSGVLYTIE